MSVKQVTCRCRQNQTAHSPGVSWLNEDSLRAPAPGRRPTPAGPRLATRPADPDDEPGQPDDCDDWDDFEPDPRLDPPWPDWDAFDDEPVEPEEGDFWPDLPEDDDC